MPLPFFLLILLAGLGGGLLGGLAGLFINWVIGDDGPDPNKTRSIAVLGLKGAGKTTLWNYLQGKRGETNVTMGETEFDIFKIPNREGKDIWIKKGKDIGGGLELVKKYYKELIEKDTYIYFLIRANDLKDKALMEDAYRRLLSIRERATELGIEQGMGFGVKLVLTHVDVSDMRVDELYACLDKLTKGNVPYIVGDPVDKYKVYETIKKEILDSKGKAVKE